MKFAELYSNRFRKVRICQPGNNDDILKGCDEIRSLRFVDEHPLPNPCMAEIV